MLLCQKDAFSLPADSCYLNGAYMSPNLKRVEEAGLASVRRKSNPTSISAEDFFKPVQEVKSLFAELVSAESFERIAVMPSVSYGMATAAANAGLSQGDEIIMIEEQFPSNYYCWKHHADRVGATIKIIKAPESQSRAEDWNALLLEAINSKTRVLTLPIVHWSDGVKFDIKSMTQKAHDNEALVCIDGTQSIGALAFSLADVPVDCLACAAYKWLLGPYSLGCTYFGPAFDDGTPIEFSWMNRFNSQDFTGLVNYQDQYKSMAHRYDMGQSSNFVNMPMLKESLSQLLEWTPTRIQEYCQYISEAALASLSSSYDIEKPEWRASHLFGIRPADPNRLDSIKSALVKNSFSVSYRGSSIRISPNVYNAKADIEKLVGILNEI